MPSVAPIEPAVEPWSEVVPLTELTCGQREQRVPVARVPLRLNKHGSEGGAAALSPPGVEPLLVGLRPIGRTDTRARVVTAGSRIDANPFSPLLDMVEGGENDEGVEPRAELDEARVDVLRAPPSDALERVGAHAYEVIRRGNARLVGDAPEWSRRRLRRMGPLDAHARFLQHMFRRSRSVSPGCWRRGGWAHLRVWRPVRRYACGQGLNLAQEEDFKQQRDRARRVLDWYRNYVELLRNLRGGLTPTVVEAFCGGGGRRCSNLFELDAERTSAASGKPSAIFCYRLQPSIMRNTPSANVVDKNPPKLPFANFVLLAVGRSLRGPSSPIGLPEPPQMTSATWAVTSALTIVRLCVRYSGHSAPDTERARPEPDIPPWTMHA